VTRTTTGTRTRNLTLNLRTITNTLHFLKTVRRIYNNKNIQRGKNDRWRRLEENRHSKISELCVGEELGNKQFNKYTD